FERLRDSDKNFPRESQWICQLYQHYPADPGLFCFLLLNFVELMPGESIFIGPGIVHAYLSGDMVEVMNLSDTVVRAGLTPKFLDSDNLLQIAKLEHQPVK